MVANTMVIQGKKETIDRLYMDMCRDYGLDGDDDSIRIGMPQKTDIVLKSAICVELTRKSDDCMSVYYLAESPDLEVAKYIKRTYKVDIKIEVDLMI